MLRDIPRCGTGLTSTMAGSMTPYDRSSSLVRGAIVITFYRKLEVKKNTSLEDLLRSCPGYVRMRDNGNI